MRAPDRDISGGRKLKLDHAAGIIGFDADRVADGDFEAALYAQLRRDRPAGAAEKEFGYATDGNIEDTEWRDIDAKWLLDGVGCHANIGESRSCVDVEYTPPNRAGGADGYFVLERFATDGTLKSPP